MKEVKDLSINELRYNLKMLHKKRLETSLANEEMNNIILFSNEFDKRLIELELNLKQEKHISQMKTEYVFRVFIILMLFVFVLGTLFILN